MRGLVPWLASALVACGAAGEDVGRVEQALSSGLVISQIYGSGGNASASYDSDFIELFNRGSSPVSLSGKSIQYASAAGTTWQALALPSKTVPAGGYFLIKLAGGTAGGGAALPSADATGTFNMGAANGRVALVDTATALSCGASCQSNPSVVDFVGFGTAADHEGSAAAPSPAGATESMQRKAGGCTETDDNGADFASAAVSPRNSATSPVTCGAVTMDASTEDTAIDSSSSSEDSSTSEPDSVAKVDSSTVEDTAVDSGTKKNGGPADLPSAATCAYPIHNRSHPSDTVALFVAALAFALSRRALR